MISTLLKFPRQDVFCKICVPEVVFVFTFVANTWSNQTNCCVDLEKIKKLWTVSYSINCTSCKFLVQDSYFKFQAKKLHNPSYILGMSSCLLHGWPGTIWQLYAVIPLHFTPLMLHYTLHSSPGWLFSPSDVWNKLFSQFYCILHLVWVPYGYM